jgi:hypothetical protein
MSVASQLCLCGGKDGKHKSGCPFHMSQSLRAVILKRDIKKDASIVTK